MKIILSDITPVSVLKLKDNPLNEQYFPDDEDSEFDALYEDIKKRGILVPLVAKRNGVLLSGHRRLKIARLMGKKSVPVQWCEQDLSAEAEFEFLIKDNVLRRHLTPDKRLALYRAAVKNFDRRVDAVTHGILTRGCGLLSLREYEYLAPGLGIEGLRYTRPVDLQAHGHREINTFTLSPGSATARGILKGYDG